MREVLQIFFYSYRQDFKVGIIDYIIKIVGGALAFGLLAIALRRKFERNNILGSYIRYPNYNKKKQQKNEREEKRM